MIDAKVDTGSFATVISSATMLKLGLEPFVEDWVELANGEPALSEVCMCRLHLSEAEEMIDIPIYVMNSDLSLGDFSASHQVDGKGRLWMEFQFNILDPSFSL